MNNTELKIWAYEKAIDAIKLNPEYLPLERSRIIQAYNELIAAEKFNLERQKAADKTK